MRYIVSDEVLQNRELAKQEPQYYRKALTATIYCESCDEVGLVIFAKDEFFSWWTCPACVNKEALNQ
jgi:hypothetical protein